MGTLPFNPCPNQIVILPLSRKETPSVPRSMALTLSLPEHQLILGVIFHMHVSRARAADTL